MRAPLTPAKLTAQVAYRLLSLSDACKREIFAAGGVVALASLLSANNEASRSNARQARRPAGGILPLAGYCLVYGSCVQV